MKNQLRTGADKGNSTVSLKQSIAKTGDGVDAMWFLSSALNVKAMEFNQVWVNGRSNFDQFKIAKCLLI